MPWLRFWTDILDSEKIADLDDASYRGWSLTLIAAKRFDHDGMLPPLRRLAYWLRRSEAVVADLLERLVSAGLLDRDGDWFRVHDWKRWQEPEDRTNAERQRRHREKKKPPSALPEEERKAETEREQSRAEETVTPPPLRNGSPTPLRNAPVTALQENSTTAPTQADGVSSPEGVVTGREGEEHEAFLKAMTILAGHKTTEHLARSLPLYAETPGVKCLAGWQLVTGACVCLNPNKSQTWDAFLAYARRATEEEYRRYTQDRPAAARASPRAEDDRYPMVVVPQGWKLRRAK